jgi:transposase-like protein
MRGRISSIKISLTDEQRDTLESLLRRQKTPVGLAKRARAILLLAEGESFTQTSERVGLGERHLRKWARRFIQDGIGGLQDRPRPGRVPVFSPSSRVVSGEDRVRTAG